MLAKLNGRNGRSRRRLPSGGLDATLSSAPLFTAGAAGAQGQQGIAGRHTFRSALSSLH